MVRLTMNSGAFAMVEGLPITIFKVREVPCKRKGFVLGHQVYFLITPSSGRLKERIEQEIEGEYLSHFSFIEKRLFMY